ncbi:MAG TPA: hypothetical protein VHE37_05725 [Nevskiaceae bacterium]|nr:hypothetical protein [Nevskiaceae bacterium]
MIFTSIRKQGGAGILLMLLAGAAQAQGCCSHHGGIKGCDAKSGMLMCEDKSLSAKCTCKYWQRQQPQNMNGRQPPTETSTHHDAEKAKQ